MSICASETRLDGIETTKMQVYTLSHFVNSILCFFENQNYTSSLADYLFLKSRWWEKNVTMHSFGAVDGLIYETGKFTQV